MEILEIQNLTKIYKDGTTALRDISFNVKKGEFAIIIGSSGAGKSTILRSINRLVQPTSGSILFQNKEITTSSKGELRKIRREMGMIFQGFHLIKRVSVLKNVLHGRLGYMNSFKGAIGAFSKEDEEAAWSLLERVGLTDQAYKRAGELSGGQQQRVAIARALAQKPALILADEPIASLDPTTSETIMNYLYQICHEDGITCIVNLHQVEVAKRYATRILGVQQGTIIFDGSATELSDSEIQHIYQKKLVV
ncbi:phosphonate ABC transporter ATP-binding protein [Evansella tamaricis]|uniref:Phosphonate ABC transporter ATP-binding protein n=1 Tax=Evansella tamaricis TaxID=2069301 RepID=A0ABS6JJ37_9BACI|nr:phosphonate ABC transporter ATP-binding protein [Evansella tamaricis]MBU9713680.1 phosphonate ABC transporter ATP-binding protein [Evansella tamaricis]